MTLFYNQIALLESYAIKEWNVIRNDYGKCNVTRVTRKNRQMSTKVAQK